MKFHALLLVRDEADIIEQCLRQLVTWADAVYVFDTGSCDSTWDMVREFSLHERTIIPLARDPVFFSEKRVRGWVFNQARRQMREGDWFVRVDADEFHHVSPREFVKTRLRSHETVAYHQYYDFHLTTSDVTAWRKGKETLADRQRPIEERRRWFTVSDYTEPRLCRYRTTMQWPETVSFPYNAGFVGVDRLPIRHYPHRDPVQLEHRCRLRAAMTADPDGAVVTHWEVKDWTQHVVCDETPGLQYWSPGAELPGPRFTNHLAPMPKRILQRLAHASLLPILDRFRTGYSQAAYPVRMPRNLQQQLERACCEPFRVDSKGEVHHEKK
jgi:hypothetical protein